MNIIRMFKEGMDRDIKPLVDFANDTVINLGCGNKIIEGTIGLDYPGWDADSMPLPFEDESVGGVIAYHFLEHVRDPIEMLKEVQRVLVVGAPVNIMVPYYTSQMQAHDLQHKHVFCEETWRNLLSNPYYSKDRAGWQLEVNTNIIIGVVERNLALMTQLVKVAK